MSELKREYWSETLVCITGNVKIDRREIAAVVISKPKYRMATDEKYHNLDVHLKSGTIFTVTEWDVNTIANLYLTESPHEGVRTTPYSTEQIYNRSHTTMFREGKASEEEE